MFNFTKNSYIDLYHDNNKSENDPKIKGFFIVLMVKPDLNLGDYDTLILNKNITDSNYASYSQNAQLGKMFKGLINPFILSNLTHSSSSYFSPIISNRVESVSYPDVGSNSEDTITTLDKAIFKLPITETGTSGMTFQMRLRENEAHDVTRMISVWHKYMHGVTKGNLSPKNEYSEYSIIDYKASLYIIHLKPDFRTITMWSKYTGIYPNNIPLSTFSEDISQVADVAIDVEFSYDKFEWMNEDLLKEINLLTSNKAITKETMEKMSPSEISEQSVPLITKIKSSPFYFIDLNGIFDYINSNGSVTPSLSAARNFGNSYNEGNGYSFAAPLTTEMVSLATSNSLTGDNSNVYKVISKRY